MFYTKNAKPSLRSLSIEVKPSKNDGDLEDTPNHLAKLEYFTNIPTP